MSTSEPHRLYFFWQKRMQDNIIKKWGRMSSARALTPYPHIIAGSQKNEEAGLS